MGRRKEQEGVRLRECATVRTLPFRTFFHHMVMPARSHQKVSPPQPFFPGMAPLQVSYLLSPLHQADSGTENVSTCPGKQHDERHTGQ